MIIYSWRILQIESSNHVISIESCDHNHARSYDPMTTNIFFRSNPSPKIIRKYSLNSTTMPGWNSSSRNSFADDQPIRYEYIVGSRRWNWKFRKSIFEIRILNFCYIHVKDILYIFHNFFMVAYLLSPNRCHW